MSLLKILSKLKISRLNRVFLNSVPVDWEEVRWFLSKSISKINELYFNTDSKVELSVSKYLESLKVASTKTSVDFVVYKTNFSSDEFRELVYAAKGTKKLCFYYSKIPLDEQVDFGNMEGSKLEYLSFPYSGGSSYSNWNAHPMRFENLVASISKSQGLKDSLNTLSIYDCEITKKKAQKVMNKFYLKSVELLGD